MVRASVRVNSSNRLTTLSQYFYVNSIIPYFMLLTAGRNYPRVHNFKAVVIVHEPDNI